MAVAAARAGEPALVLVLDIDHFKRVNDTHGHAAGDLVLKAVSEALLECVRPMDTVARIGGEEFAIVLPNCPPAFGPTVAERVRTRVERRPVTIGLTEQISVTISIGCASVEQDQESTIEALLGRADAALYKAKGGGRNRVISDGALGMADV